MQDRTVESCVGVQSMQQKLLGQKRATSPVGSSSMSEWLNCEWLLVNTLCAKEITVWKIGNGVCMSRSKARKNGNAIEYGIKK